MPYFFYTFIPTVCIKLLHFPHFWGLSWVINHIKFLHVCVYTKIRQLFEGVHLLTFAFANFYVTYLNENLIANIFIATSTYAIESLIICTLYNLIPSFIKETMTVWCHSLNTTISLPLVKGSAIRKIKD